MARLGSRAMVGLVLVAAACPVAGDDIVASTDGGSAGGSGSDTAAMTMPVADDDGTTNEDDTTGAPDDGGSTASSADDAPASTDTTAAADSGTSPSDSDGEGGSDSSGESGPAEPCPPATAACVPAAPAGWSGPIAVRTAATAEKITCGGTFGTALLDQSFAFVAGEHDCDCGCMPFGPEAYTCVGAILRVYDNSTCSGAAELITAVNAPCDDLANFDATTHWFRAPPTQISQDVDDNPGCNCPQNIVIDTPTFASHLLGCSGPPIAGQCGADEVCLPDIIEPFEPAPCIFQAGDLECPPDSPYADRRVVYSGYDDTRGCTECVDLPADGSCSGLTVALFSNGTCSGGAFNVIGPSCELGSSTGGTLMSSALGPTADQIDAAVIGDLECFLEDGSGEPTGTVVPTGAVTVCCAE